MIIAVNLAYVFLTYFMLFAYGGAGHGTYLPMIILSGWSFFGGYFLGPLVQAVVWAVLWEAAIRYRRVRWLLTLPGLHALGIWVVLEAVGGEDWDRHGAEGVWPAVLTASVFWVVYLASARWLRDDGEGQG
ncbi:MAG TPA: hypothetical protein VLU25_12135 [Acidobacteriota bacterium]|nr:hypothetical protein [Acidobacteriota bacterium]